MAWLKDPEGEGHPKIGLTYRLLRKLNRSLMSTWFRELDIVDNENMPHEGGIMFVAWHPSGLIDPVLLHASLPGKLSILAKHTLFNLPILGRLFLQHLSWLGEHLILSGFCLRETITICPL